MNPILAWTDSDEVIHAKQAINAYEFDRAKGDTREAAAHLLVAYQALMRAHFALLQEIQCQKCPQPAKG